MTIDDEKLMAFADGELRGSERQEVERALAADAGLRERLETQQQLKATLASHYGPVASEPVPDRLLAMLGATAAPGDIASLAEARAKRQGRRHWGNWGAMAASLALGLLAGQMLPGRSGPVATEDGVLVAGASLAEDLDTQLASAPAAGETRIGLTFADKEGRMCRTFDASELSGLACLDGGDWRLVVTAAAGAQGTEYRQAGSAALIEAAQQIMAGEPLDAAEERAAMRAGWKISGQPRD